MSNGVVSHILTSDLNEQCFVGVLQELLFGPDPRAELGGVASSFIQLLLRATEADGDLLRHLQELTACLLQSRHLQGIADRQTDRQA